MNAKDAGGWSRSEAKGCVLHAERRTQLLKIKT